MKEYTPTMGHVVLLLEGEKKALNRLCIKLHSTLYKIIQHSSATINSLMYNFLNNLRIIRIINIFLIILNIIILIIVGAVTVLTLKN